MTRIHYHSKGDLSTKESRYNRTAQCERGVEEYYYSGSWRVGGANIVEHLCNQTETARHPRWALAHR